VLKNIENKTESKDENEQVLALKWRRGNVILDDSDSDQGSALQKCFLNFV